MSIEMLARFGATRLTWDSLFEQLNAALAECGYDFTGFVIQLDVEMGRLPSLALNAEEPLGTETDLDLRSAARRAVNWPGMGFECVSRTLRMGLGVSDATEVSFAVFRAPGGLALTFEESAKATDYRETEDDASKDLYRLMLTLCAQCRFPLGIYEEGGLALDGKAAIPTVTDLEAELISLNQVHRTVDFVATASSKLIALERARELSGWRAGSVQMNTDGLILFPFLGEL